MDKNVRIIFNVNESPNYVDGTEFKDEDLLNIPGSTDILNLELSNVTDAGIKQLPKLPRLICLDLDGTSITDESMKIIGTFHSLKELWIEQTTVTDEGIKSLLSLTNLEFISFLDTAVTDKGEQLLRRNINGIEIG